MVSGLLGRDSPCLLEAPQAALVVSGQNVAASKIDVVMTSTYGRYRWAKLEFAGSADGFVSVF